MPAIVEAALVKLKSGMKKRKKAVRAAMRPRFAILAGQGHLAAFFADLLQAHFDLAVRIEDRRVEMQAAALEVFVEGGDGAGGAEVSCHLAVGVDACLAELEDVLHHDLLAFHASDLRDGHHLARPV